ncbi:MAG: XdhC family protein [Gammaproteobacteria bacterium]|nr:XdhC family protein [Gammaproteobacteria bacterium]NNJ49411.1 XdhC family protein [Gammaproteobacteria bacterium]
MSDQADDIDVLENALSWLRSGHQVALATVIKTWGSSPRPPGSLLVMNDAGQFAGSVSGGCVEESLLARYCNGELAGPAPTMVDFGVDRQQASRMGLPCGGRLEVLVEQLSDAESVAPLLQQLRDGALVSRKVNLATGEVDLKQGNGSAEFKLSEASVVKTFGPAWQLLLIGDGQLARHLTSMALHLDYRVTICDPRENYVQSAPLTGVNYSHLMPDDAVQELTEQTRSAIVTLAHDPRQDDLGLSAALESQAFYIGALGSTRSAQARRERLASLGYSAQQLKRIHGPAGLNIGSKRPAEIAVSILAQITAIRNGIEQQRA